MAGDGQLESKGEKPGNKPEPKDSLREGVDANIKLKAEKLLAEPTFIDKLKPETIQKFAESHLKENYQGYREWNGDFCKSVLGIEESKASEQLVRVMALQLFLNHKVKGFSDKNRGMRSIDGKLGPFTLNKLTEYYNSTIRQPESKAEEPKPEAKAMEKKPEQTQSQPKETSPGVVSRLPEGEKYGKDETFYAGDSIMVGITGGRRVDASHISARESSHLVKTKKFDKKWYRKDKIFVEEEAMKFLDNRKCKMLVINGGINDLGARGRTDKVRDQIIDTYKKIIEEAHKRSKKVTIYTSNDESEAQTNGTKSIYKWLAEKSGADVVVDSTKIVDGRYARDGLHPQATAYRDLYKSLDFLRALA